MRTFLNCLFGRVLKSLDMHTFFFFFSVAVYSVLYLTCLICTLFTFFYVCSDLHLSCLVCELILILCLFRTCAQVTIYAHFFFFFFYFVAVYSDLYSTCLICALKKIMFIRTCTKLPDMRTYSCSLFSRTCAQAVRLSVDSAAVAPSVFLLFKRRQGLNPNGRAQANDNKIQG